MSYRTVKRLLGETRLERKFLFLFAGLLFVLIIASFALYGFRTERVVYQQNSLKGRLLAALALYSVHWNELETNEQKQLVIREIMRGTSNEQYKSEFLLPNDPQQTAKLTQYEKELLSRFQSEPINVPKDDPAEKAAVMGMSPPPPSPDESTSREDPLGPLSGIADTPDNETDAMNSLIASSANADDDKVEFAEILSHDRNWYHYYQPIRAREGCLLACHQPPPGGTDIFTDIGPVGATVTRSTAQRPGELLAVIKVTLSNKPMETQLGVNRAWLWLTATISFFVTLLVSNMIIRYVISKPLQHLREVSDEVRQGNTTVRARIRTGDEFELLAVAFNRMLKRLVKIQNDLRASAVKLDGKVDELAQANMQLHQLNQIKSDFLATMSHELRTPLNSILGFSEVLGDAEALDERQKRYVSNIRTSGRLLLDMINDILDLAKIEAGRMELRPSQFQLEPILTAACDAARLRAQRRGIELRCHVQSDIPPMLQDRARVQQIVGNLLSNAVKFTPQGGKISLTARHDSQDQLILQVADSGVGIAEDEQQVIFEKFRQGTTAIPHGDVVTREHSGAGLGLSIVRELCLLLSGDITLQSELGSGSTFTVTLPWRLSTTPHLGIDSGDDLDTITRPALELPPTPDARPSET